MIERKDKLKNKAKVTKALIKDPTLTEQQLKEKTGLGAGTVHRQRKEVEKNGVESDIMDKILQMDDEIMDLVNSLTVKHIKEKINKNEKLETQEIKLLGDLANNSTKRKAIFGDKGEGDKTYQFIIS